MSQPPTDVDQLEIRFYYTDEETAGLVENSLRMKWWNGSSWENCSPSGVNSTDNYIWANIRSDTSPSLSQLTGTPFSATGKRVVIPAMSWWGGVAMGLLFLSAIAWSLRRQRTLSKAKQGLK